MSKQIQSIKTVKTEASPNMDLNWTRCLMVRCKGAARTIFLRKTMFGRNPCAKRRFVSKNYITPITIQILHSPWVSLFDVLWFKERFQHNTTPRDVRFFLLTQGKSWWIPRPSGKRGKVMWDSPARNIWTETYPLKSLRVSGPWRFRGRDLRLCSTIHSPPKACLTCALHSLMWRGEGHHFSPASILEGLNSAGEVISRSLARSPSSVGKDPQGSRVLVLGLLIRLFPVLAAIDGGRGKIPS